MKVIIKRLAALGLSITCAGLLVVVGPMLSESHSAHAEQCPICADGMGPMCGSTHECTQTDPSGACLSWIDSYFYYYPN